MLGRPGATDEIIGVPTCARLFTGLLLALVLSLCLATPVSAEGGASEVDHLVGLVNGERAAAGLPALRVDAPLDHEGAAHSARMAEAGTIFHNDDLFTPATKDRLGAKTVGENVASNASLDDAHRRLMASDGHRANILSAAFDRIGVGVVQVGSTWYVTEVFVQSRVAAAPKPAPSPSTTAAPAPATTAPAVTTTSVQRPPAPKAPASRAVVVAPVPAPVPAAAATGAVDVTLTVTADPVETAEPSSVPLDAVTLGDVAPASTSGGRLTSDQLGVLTLTAVALALVVGTAGSAARRALRFS